mmetsp:Transcript_104011/g.291418  ORF Transcript_104011/g.291418 Transcript_104011/m.291418 type:complete len:103 (-) Transcript_104011:115-423(-)
MNMSSGINLNCVSVFIMQKWSAPTSPRAEVHDRLGWHNLDTPVSGPMGVGCTKEAISNQMTVLPITMLPRIQREKATASSVKNNNMLLRPRALRYALQKKFL